MTKRVDVDKIAKGLGAERRGKVPVSGGQFGAMQLVAEVQARFRIPTGGGRATDPSWKTKRLVPLKEQTLKRLAQLAHEIEEKRQIHIEPMQVAAMLLERTLVNVTEEDAEEIVRSGSAD
jgi:hypothetical protein